MTSPTPTTPLTADDARYMRYVARQPILNADESVLGYELLFRDGVVDYFASPDSDAASRSTLDASLLLGLDVLCDGRLAFINCTRDLLLNDYITLLPPDRVVVEILETVPADEAVIAACHRLKKAGYKIALDDFVPGDPRQPLTGLADIIKIDIRRVSLAKSASILPRGERLRLLAEKVETREEFLATRKAGFAYFQGYFFRRPELMQAREIPANRVNYLRLLKAVSQAELDPRELENVIKGEASLCYRLLRYLNSPLFGFPAEIRSVRHALAMLGEREVRRWIRLAATLVASQSRSSDMVLAALGARPLLRIAGAEPAAWRSRFVSGGAAFADGRDSRHPHGPGVGGHLAGPGDHGGAAGTQQPALPDLRTHAGTREGPMGEGGATLRPASLARKLHRGVSLESDAMGTPDDHLPSHRCLTPGSGPARSHISLKSGKRRAARFSRKIAKTELGVSESLRGSDMNAEARAEEGLSAVPLHSAVFCVDCETVSNSQHDACSVCGSHSLISLFRMLGGTLRSQKPPSTEDRAKTAKYNLELTLKVHEIPANELNRAIESLSRLAEVCGDLESLHINVESVFVTQGMFRAA